MLLRKPKVDRHESRLVCCSRKGTLSTLFALCHVETRREHHLRNTVSRPSEIRRLLGACQGLAAVKGCLLHCALQI